MARRSRSGRRPDGPAPRASRRRPRLGSSAATLLAAVITSAALLTAALINYGFGGGGSAGGPATPAPKVVDRTPTSAPPAEAATPSPSRHGRPKAKCSWLGDGKCKASVTKNPQGGSAGECGGSGGQGSGGCSARVD
ncbi:hypothetical protein [Actinomadura monticuli]|uniref:Uncharacterized protein n=1 Tax=Actinomadura monticuli TaxID=3097367 RepID=A0ABV4QE41_9ACTN